MGYALDFTGERFLPWLARDDPFVSYEHVHRYLIASNYVSEKRVLDIACGEGYGTAMLARTARSVIGIDSDMATLRHAKQHHGKENTLFVRADAQQFHLGENSIDVVVSYETLEHFTSHKQFLAAIRFALTDDGLLFISTPNRAMYNDEDQEDNPFHARELYREEFVQLLRQHFRHVRLFGQSIMANSMIAEATGEYILRKRKNCQVRLTAIDGTSMEYPTKVESSMRPRYYIAICSNKELRTFSDDLMVDDHATLVRSFVDHHRRWSTVTGENAALSTQVQHLSAQVQDKEREKQAAVAQMQHEEQKMLEQMQQSEQMMREQMRHNEQMVHEQLRHNEQMMREQLQQAHLQMIDEMNSVQQILIQRMEVVMKREAEERAAFVAVQQQLLQRDAEIIKLKDALEQSREQFTAKDRGLQHLEAQYAALARHKQDQDTHIQGLETYRADQQRIIEEQIKSIKHEQQNIGEAHRHYENALREIAQQAKLIAERDDYIGVLTRALDERDRNIEELHRGGALRRVAIVPYLRRKLVALVSN